MTRETCVRVYVFIISDEVEEAVKSEEHQNLMKYVYVYNYEIESLYQIRKKKRLFAVK